MGRMYSMVKQGMQDVSNNKYGSGREALLKATIEVVGQRGLHGLTFRAVAELANVNNSLVSYHFGNKDTLLREAVHWAVSYAITLSDFSDLEKRSDNFAQNLVDFVKNDPNLHIFQYEFILESRRRPELKCEATALYEAYIDTLEKVLIQHGHANSRPLARAVFAALDGLIFQQLTLGDPNSIQQAIGCIGELLKGHLLVTSQSKF
ncbi:TetR/AcrR family transcriptional regulator [Acinetobacter sp. ME22]|uniref:TetR/AcrR family transcriptional regulator n=1 Tax=Acinetobacter sp. ME22 TaxID=2904802 RepID=UPI001EDB084C|nr:TetR/AcrR family transcriptional regulator [Acinetobacter sp. ME22]MCG2575116.1 TetR/AcrR family transcriptional regulator [Acinetobacter sp. ME22]